MQKVDQGQVQWEEMIKKWGEIMLFFSVQDSS